MKMASVMSDAISLMQRVGSGVKKNLVRSNEGLSKIPTKRLANLEKSREAFLKGFDAKQGNDLVDHLEKYRPASYRMGEGAESWSGMTGDQKRSAIKKDYNIRMKQQRGLIDTISNVQDKGTVGTFSALQQQYASSGEAGKLDTIKSGVKAAGLMAQDYYLGGNLSQTATRVGVTAGAYMTGASGVRYLSGGSVGYNSNGERDIAGIPFM